MLGDQSGSSVAEEEMRDVVDGAWQELAAFYGRGYTPDLPLDAFEPYLEAQDPARTAVLLYCHCHGKVKLSYQERSALPEELPAYVESEAYRRQLALAKGGFADQDPLYKSLPPLDVAIADPALTGSAWKLHLNVPPDSTEPPTKHISEYLAHNSIPFKVSDVPGKAMTIYVGSYDDAIRVADALEGGFGRDLQPIAEYALDDDRPLTPSGAVAGRFDTQFNAAASPDPAFSRYGAGGVPLRWDALSNLLTGQISEREAVEASHAQLIAKHGEYYTGTDDRARIDWVDHATRKLEGLHVPTFDKEKPMHAQLRALPRDARDQLWRREWQLIVFDHDLDMPDARRTAAGQLLTISDILASDNPQKSRQKANATMLRISDGVQDHDGDRPVGSTDKNSVPYELRERLAQRIGANFAHAHNRHGIATQQLERLIPPLVEQQSSNNLSGIVLLAKRELMDGLTALQRQGALRAGPNR